MAIRDIIFYPDPRLKEVCEPVYNFDSELHQLLDDMAQTMYAAPGVGLAAPQIGILRQITVVDVSHDKSELIEFINPEIIDSSGKSVYEEGCLSIPGFNEKVTRPANVTVRAQDRKGDQFEIEADDLLATCVQHEIDHLNGILFVDHLSRLKRELFKRWFRKNEPLESLEE